MKDVNKLILVGRLGGDPVLRQTKKSIPVVSFSLATNYRLVSNVTEAQQPVEQTTQWHRIVLFGKRANWCSQRLNRGDSVFVQGSLRSRTFEKQEGVSKEVFEVYADDVTLLRKAAAKTTEAKETEAKENDEGNQEQDFDSDLHSPGREFPVAKAALEPQLFH